MASPPPSSSEPVSPKGPFAAFVVEKGDDRVDAGVRELTVDDLAPGAVTIGIEWSAINYKDGMTTQPGNRVARISPLIPGVDLAGTVLESSDPAFTPGQAVIAHGYDLGVAHNGGFAQLARVPSEWVVALPPGLDSKEAATIGTAGFTAALSLHRLVAYGLEPGDGPVLVTGATGGVGSMAVSLLSSKGYEVVASTGKATERDYLVGLGAADVITRDDLLADPQRTLAKERWAGAIDCVGGATLAAILRSLRYGAAVAASGLTGGSGLETTVFPFITRNVSLIGIDTVVTPIDERRAVWAEDVLNGWSKPHLAAMVEGEVGLGELRPALDRILQGGMRGRMLVKP
jgi:acrylyl-CoA reductase (NADPH)